MHHIRFTICDHFSNDQSQLTQVMKLIIAIMFLEYRETISITKKLLKNWKIEVIEKMKFMLSRSLRKIFVLNKYYKFIFIMNKKSIRIFNILYILCNIFYFIYFLKVYSQQSILYVIWIIINWIIIWFIKCT